MAKIAFGAGNMIEEQASLLLVHGADRFPEQEQVVRGNLRPREDWLGAGSSLIFSFWNGACSRLFTANACGGWVRSYSFNGIDQ